MRKNQVRLLAAGMFVLAFMTGCSLNDNDINEGSNSIISTDVEDAGNNAGEQAVRTFGQVEKGDAGNNAGEQESQPDSENGQRKENTQLQEPQLQPQASEASESVEASENAGASEVSESSEDIEEELAAYRAERERGTSSRGDYTMVELPNEEKYNYGIGDSSYTSRFDSRELNEAFEAAEAYVKGTLKLEGEVWACIDPRMTAIYEDEDKGAARGYDADNIFLCEYNDNGNWQYLILVRKGKGSDWEVLHHGSSYKTD